MKKIFTIIFLLVCLQSVNAQITPRKKLDNNKLQQFREVKTGSNKNSGNNTINFYPLNDDDFWEYIESDTITFMGNTGELSTSVVKEIIGDTTMPNALVYKIIKWENCANIIKKEPRFEFLRKDTSGKVFIYYESEDKLLYDFDKNVGDIYPSHYEDHHWEILKKYTVTGFGQQLAAIDLGLYNDHDSNIQRKETITEEFGLTYYRGEINNKFFDVPEGSFFGGIINNTTYGDLLAKRQKIDWKEFYPLHIGDIWKYEGNEGSIPTVSFTRVIGDTLLPDGHIYKVIYSKSGIGGPFPGEGSYYERLDSSKGIVYGWNNGEKKAIETYRFHSCLGDTYSAKIPNSFFMLIEKNYDQIKYELFPSIVLWTFGFSRGIGYSFTNSELSGSSLVGAVIDGKVSGDTTGVYGITNIEYEPNLISHDYFLFQNYPNPFNPVTTIKYTVSKYTKVSLTIYDILGREITVLVNESKQAGIYSVEFNGNNLPSGIYFYELATNSFRNTKKMLLIK